MIGDSLPGGPGARTDATSYLGLVSRSLGLRRDSPWVMLAAYFDESGTQDGSNFLVVAGLVSTVAKWEELTRLWSALLADKGLRSFHTVDCAQGTEDFASWSARDRSDLYVSLVHLMKRHVMWRTWSAVVLPDYLRSFSDRNRKAALRLVYSVCVTSCANHVRQLVGENEPLVPYALERGGLGSKFAVRALMENPKLWKIGAITMDSRENLVPLQPADAHAYEVYKYFTNQVSDSPRPTRRSLEEMMLIPEAGGGGTYYDLDQIADLTRALKNGVTRLELRTDALASIRIEKNG